MSDAGTQKLVKVYEDMAPPAGHLTSYFRSPPQNFHLSEEVEIDIKRHGRSIAIALNTITADGHKNEVSQFTNKKFKPPVYQEQTVVDAFQGLKRAAGDAPHAEREYRGKLLQAVVSASLEMHSKIGRSVEVMASQVLQTGKLTLLDENGEKTYELDFKPKAAHFPTAGNDWNSGSAAPLTDLASLAEVVRKNGKVNPNRLDFGSDAWTDFTADTEVQAILDNRRTERGFFRPEKRGDGSTRQGVISVGDYEFELFTYPDSYDHPQTGADTKYITSDNVIMTSDRDTVLDLTFGDIPVFPNLDGVVRANMLTFVPRRVPGASMMLDLHWSAWLSQSAKFMTVEAATRPLTIPTGIDTFGCLNTRA